MRAYIPAFEACTPTSLTEALTLLKNEPGKWRPLAGGTDLMVLIESGALENGRFLNLQRLHELHGIRVTADEIKIGALATFREIRNHETLAKDFPLLVQAAQLVGAIAIQNRGTIGGNIANASPAADSPAALLVYDARVELVSSAGSRWLPYESFHTGYKKTALRSDELIRSVALPRRRPNNDNWITHYRKVGTRNAQAISKICFAARALKSAHENVIQDIRIAFGSVAPTVLRCQKTEDFLRGKRADRKTVQEAKMILASEISPIDDVRSNAEYRLRVSLNLLEDFLIHVELGR